MAKKIKNVTFECQQKWFDVHQRSLEFEEIMYEPFWRVEDVRSFGIKTKIAHFSTPGRVMHLLSQNELWMYLDIAQNLDIVETYEQFAIPLEFSLPIAKALDVKHPVYIGSNKVPIIQTIDFVSIRSDGTRVAHPVKQKSDALRFRTQEKLAIQEAYCELEHIDYQLVTSTTLRTVKSENLEALFRHRNISYISHPQETLIAGHTKSHGVLLADLKILICHFVHCRFGNLALPLPSLPLADGRPSTTSGVCQKARLPPY